MVGKVTHQMLTILSKIILKDFLLNNYSLLTRLFEGSAFLIGYIYYLKNRNDALRFFILFLGVTFFVEVIGYYPKLMQEYYDKGLFLGFKNSIFRHNFWLYNLYLLVNISLLFKYFKKLINSEKSKKIFSLLFYVFLLFSITYWIITGTFFHSASIYNFIFGSSIIITGVLIYFYQIINSDQILYFKGNIIFYLSTILFVWHIVTTPLFIFGSFYNLDNPGFVEFRKIVLLSSNILMYLSFTLCFIYFLYKKKF